MEVEALLACSCGIWGLEFNDCLEQGVGFSWVLLRNDFAFFVEGLDGSQAPEIGCINIGNMLSIK